MYSSQVLPSRNSWEIDGFNRRTSSVMNIRNERNEKKTAKNVIHDLNAFAAKNIRQQKAKTTMNRNKPGNSISFNHNSSILPQIPNANQTFDYFSNHMTQTTARKAPLNATAFDEQELLSLKDATTRAQTHGTDDHAIASQLDNLRTMMRHRNANICEISRTKMVKEKLREYAILADKRK
jgi:hypothetical protein